jgi:hypothetical protein
MLFYLIFWVIHKCSYDFRLIARTRCHFCWRIGYMGSESLCRKVSNLVKFTAANLFIRRKSCHTHTHTHTHTHNWIDCIVCVWGTAFYAGFYMTRGKCFR